PNLIISAPFDEVELRNLMYSAQFTQQPYAIRYPRGTGYQTNWEQPFQMLEEGKAIVKKEGEKVAVLSTGTIGNAINSLKGSFTHVHFPFVKPLDYKMLKKVFQNYQVIITYEEGVVKGGFGHQVMHYAQRELYKGSLFIQGYPDTFIEHGRTEELKEQIGFSKKQIQAFIMKKLASEI
ncbi:MAG: transketolase C-terminal domain-containing protein, partial [Flavobacteriales bacterium]